MGRTVAGHNLPQIGKRNFVRISRIVTLPDYQGVGIGSAVLDAVARLIPGGLGSDESAGDESFTSGRLEHPHFSPPARFGGRVAC